MDGRTDQQKERQTWRSLIVASCNFVKMSKNVQIFFYSGGTHFEHWLEHLLFSGFRECTHGLWGHAVVQLVEALRYKPEGRGFDS